MACVAIKKYNILQSKEASHESINQSINQWINESIDRSINHSIDRSINHLIDQSTNCRLKCQTAYWDVTETTFLHCSWGRSSFLKYSTIVLLSITPELLTPINTSSEVPSNLERICIFLSYKTTGRRVQSEAKPPNKVVICSLSEPVPNVSTSRVPHSAYTLPCASPVRNGDSFTLTIPSGSVKKLSSCSVVNSMIQASHVSWFLRFFPAFGRRRTYAQLLMPSEKIPEPLRWKFGLA